MLLHSENLSIHYLQVRASTKRPVYNLYVDFKRLVEPQRTRIAES